MGKVEKKPNSLKAAKILSKLIKRIIYINYAKKLIDMNMFSSNKLYVLRMLMESPIKENIINNIGKNVFNLVVKGREK